MAAAQIVLAFVPLVIAAVAVIVAALLEPWRARGNRAPRTPGGQDGRAHRSSRPQ